jgi:HEXXH motif-containing protein
MIPALAQAFVRRPAPLWETPLTAALVAAQWERLGLTPASYHTASLFPSDQPGQARPQARIPLLAGAPPFLELPEPDRLGGFYADHGLECVPAQALPPLAATEKLGAALKVLQALPELWHCLHLLVQSIQVLRQDDPETDASFSHPDIPFTIFVTLCPDMAPVSNLRVAESILHEAMHLKLTLIEGVLPLVAPNSTATYYSPWRNEARPLRGVLHGMFVFRAVLDGYAALLPGCTDAAERRFMAGRVGEIRAELALLRDFGDCEGLTSGGRHLAQSLLP